MASSLSRKREHDDEVSSSDESQSSFGSADFDFEIDPNLEREVKEKEVYLQTQKAKRQAQQVQLAADHELAKQMQRREDNASALNGMQCTCGSGKTVFECCAGIKEPKEKEMSLFAAHSSAIRDAAFSENAVFDNERPFVD